MATFSISVVYFQPDISLVYECIKSVNRSLARLYATGLVSGTSLWLIDNSTDQEITQQLRCLSEEHINQELSPVRVLGTDKNLGYGMAHNLAIAETSADYHLVLNPDVMLEEDALQNALDFMEQHPEVALLTPSSVNEQGEKEYLNKRHPGLLTLLIRGFAPALLKNRFLDRIAHYEMRDLDPDKVHYDPPLASGCFMLFRTPVLKRLGGFSEKFFLYFEDYDLSIRTREFGRIAYVPGVRITHFGGGAAKKGLKHIYFFIRSAITFFQLHGWKLW